MYVIRDIFHLKFGHYREVKVLFDEGVSNNLFPATSGFRLLTDFTGDSYRLIMEMSVETLAQYEKELKEEVGTANWRDWYEKFKPHVVSSHREILRQIMYSK